MTERAARGIAEEFPTANALFEAYEAAPDARARDGLVARCKVGLMLYSGGIDGEWC